MNNNDQFIYLLLGLIDRDGCLLITKYIAIRCEISVHERDVKALYKIKKKISWFSIKKK